MLIGIWGSDTLSMFYHYQHCLDADQAPTSDSRWGSWFNLQLMGAGLWGQTCSCGSRHPGLAASSITLGGIRCHCDGVRGLWEQTCYYGLLNGGKKNGNSDSFLIWIGAFTVLRPLNPRLHKLKLYTDASAPRFCSLISTVTLSVSEHARDI